MSGTRRLLVTSGSGFVGRRVVQRALSAGWQVASVALPGDTAPAGWRGVHRIEADLADPAAIERLPRTADLIVHLAAPVGVAGDYQRQWDIMVEGTRHVCAVARPGTRVVEVSSIAVYGDRIQTQRCHERDGFGAWQGAYGRAKQGKETLARELALSQGFELVIMRPANVYGLGGASAWGDRLVEAIRASGGGVIGDADRNNAGLTYVENLADALWLAATHPAAAGETFNVCDGLDVTWRVFFDDMAALAGKPPPPAYGLAMLMAAAQANEDPAALMAPRDPNLPFLEALNLVGFDNRIDAEHIRQCLGWSPHVSYAQALAKMAAAFTGGES